VHVRRRKNGEIVAVKHSTFGWMSPKEYYFLQKAHDAMPLLEEVIRGGYQVNAMVWGFNPEISILGEAIPIPAGAALLGTSVWNLYQEIVSLQAGEPHWERLLYVAWSVLGPFGAILQIMDSIQAVLDPTNPAVPAQLKPSAWEALYKKAQEAKRYQAPPRL
jgi:hypothetical protein